MPDDISIAELAALIQGGAVLRREPPERLRDVLEAMLAALQREQPAIDLEPLVRVLDREPAQLDLEPLVRVLGRIAEKRGPINLAPVIKQLSIIAENSKPCPPVPYVATVERDERGRIVTIRMEPDNV